MLAATSVTASCRIRSSESESGQFMGTISGRKRNTQEAEASWVLCVSRFGSLLLVAGSRFGSRLGGGCGRGGLLVAGSGCSGTGGRGGATFARRCVFFLGLLGLLHHDLHDLHLRQPERA